MLAAVRPMNPADSHHGQATPFTFSFHSLLRGQDAGTGTDRDAAELYKGNHRAGGHGARMTRMSPRTFSGLMLALMASSHATDALCAQVASPPTISGHLAFSELTLNQAVQMAQARYQARVVRADTERDGDHIYYRLRLLSADGRVFTVRVDSRTGNMQ